MIEGVFFSPLSLSVLSVETRTSQQEAEAADRNQRETEQRLRKLFGSALAPPLPAAHLSFFTVQNVYV